MDKTGNVIVPPIYESIGEFGKIKEGIAIIESPAGLKGIIDSTGQLVLEPKYNFIENADDYNKDWLKVELDSYFGFIDLYGNEVVPPIYDVVAPPQKTASAIHFKLETVK